MLPRCAHCGAGNVAAVSAVAWASPDAQRSMVQIGLDCAATDPAERETVEGARALLLALAEGMPGYSPLAVRACGARRCGVSLSLTAHTATGRFPNRLFVRSRGFVHAVAREEVGWCIFYPEYCAAMF
jgi:hypothetical protein